MILFLQGNVYKIYCRHQRQRKAQDILKAIHFLEMIIERDYDADTSI